jgi:hypothetical protein
MSEYVFTTPLAFAALEKAKEETPCCLISGIHMSGERNSISLDQELKDLFGERNPAGQTLLYCLLRFTQNPLLRDCFLKAATPEQLAAQNTNCGSTALMGYFWGEHQNPRMKGETPVADIFAILKEKGALGAASKRNHRGETALGFAMEIAFWRPADYPKLQKLLAEAPPAAN